MDINIWITDIRHTTFSTYALFWDILFVQKCSCSSIINVDSVIKDGNKLMWTIKFDSSQVDSNTLKPTDEFTLFSTIIDYSTRIKTNKKK